MKNKISLAKNYMKTLPGLYFGFLTERTPLDRATRKRIAKLVGVESQEVVTRFERDFAKMIGTGEAVSYAAARMGFYELMCALGIGRGDEVILLGFNCSVMPLAVMRAGATPVYSDIDPNTFGTSAAGIKRVMTNRTKMVVAQHTFGIPCEIMNVREICDEHGVFLLEDCALSLGSTKAGRVLGTIGDAAVFSTDHSKPINTLAGGLIYSEKPEIIDALRARHEDLESLSVRKQKSMWKQTCLENHLSAPSILAYTVVWEIISAKLFRIKGKSSPFIDDGDITSEVSTEPFPAKMPSFIAEIGSIEVAERPFRIESLRKGLSEMIQMLSNIGTVRIPACYFDETSMIVPLRFITSQPNGSYIRDLLSPIIRVSWTWFMQPIISTEKSLDYFHYKAGSCMVAETTGLGTIQIPIPASLRDQNRLFRKIASQLGSKHLGALRN